MSLKSGRKIPNTIQSPIDDLILQVLETIGPYVGFNKHTPLLSPNMLTTASLLVSIVGVYEISRKNYRKGAILTFIGYVFDCSDGYVARRFDMVTQFGDLYDHLSDILKLIFLLAIIFTLDIHRKTKILFMMVFGVFLILSLLYMGCVEHYYPGEVSVLTPLKMLCPDKSMIKYFRFTGTGFFFLVISLFIYNMEAIDDYIAEISQQ